MAAEAPKIGDIQPQNWPDLKTKQSRFQIYFTWLYFGRGFLICQGSEIGHFGGLGGPGAAQTPKMIDFRSLAHF